MAKRTTDSASGAVYEPEEDRTLSKATFDTAIEEITKRSVELLESGDRKGQPLEQLLGVRDIIGISEIVKQVLGNSAHGAIESLVRKFGRSLEVEYSCDVRSPYNYVAHDSEDQDVFGVNLSRYSGDREENFVLGHILGHLILHALLPARKNINSDAFQYSSDLKKWRNIISHRKNSGVGVVSSERRNNAAETQADIFSLSYHLEIDEVLISDCEKEQIRHLVDDDLVTSYRGLLRNIEKAENL